MTDINEILKKQPILLIDGDCILCNNSVNYLLAHEKKKRTKVKFCAAKKRNRKNDIGLF